MKPYLTGFLLLSLLLARDASAVAIENLDRTDPEAVMRAYYLCLSEGDLASLTSLIGGDLLEKKRRLLNNRNRYETFLRNYYQDSQLLSIRTNPAGEGKIQSVLEILMKDGVVYFKLILTQLDGNWIITEDITR